MSIPVRHVDFSKPLSKAQLLAGIIRPIGRITLQLPGIWALSAPFPRLTHRGFFLHGDRMDEIYILQVKIKLPWFCKLQGERFS